MPVIIYSAYSAQQEIEGLYKKGASLFVSKPHSYDELTAILKAILKIEWDTFDLKNAQEYFKDMNAVKIPE